MTWTEYAKHLEANLLDLHARVHTGAYRALPSRRKYIPKADGRQRPNSSGGKQKLGRISKMGNRNLRKLLVVAAHAVLFHRKPHTDPPRMWANCQKDARIAFAIMRGTTVYREIPA